MIIGSVIAILFVYVRRSKKKRAQ
ncbi:EYxxD motif small membrane protein [Bacillus sp. REN10]